MNRLIFIIFIISGCKSSHESLIDNKSKCNLDKATEIAINFHGKMSENDSISYLEDNSNFIISIHKKRLLTQIDDQVTMRFGGGTEIHIDKKTCEVKQRLRYQ